MTADARDPWWASGQGPDEDPPRDEDPFEQHRRRARGSDAHGGPGGTTDAAWVADVVDLLTRMASRAGRRVTDRAAEATAGPRPEGHADGQVCDACPICIGLRAVQASRPEVLGHLADAANHLSLALRALADGAGPVRGVERIDLDP